MRFLVVLIRLLFPESPGRNRAVFDFSNLSFEEFAENASYSNNVETGTITACLSYKNPLVRSMIWQIKTKKNRHAIACGGYILSKKIKSMLQPNSEPPIIMPIPINRLRRHERGYNQCELLAKEIKENFKNDGIDIEIKINVLFRNQQKGNGKKQAFKNRSERISEIHDVFFVDATKLQKIPSLKNCHIIVIDDVITTGSTIREAIATLKKAGCKNVSGLALAH